MGPLRCPQGHGDPSADVLLHNLASKCRVVICKKLSQLFNGIASIIGVLPTLNAMGIPSHSDPDSGYVDPSN